MAYTPNEWKDRQGVGLNRWRDQYGNLLILTPDPVSVDEQGTPLTSDWMNHIEQGVAVAAPLVVKDIIVPVAAWQANALYATYPRRAAIEIDGVTADMVPIIAFSVDAIELGTMGPVAHAYNGGVYIYAASTPASDITVLSVVLVH